MRSEELTDAQENGGRKLTEMISTMPYIVRNTFISTASVHDDMKGFYTERQVQSCPVSEDDVVSVQSGSNGEPSLIEQDMTKTKDAG